MILVLQFYWTSGSNFRRTREVMKVVTDSARRPLHLVVALFLMAVAAACTPDGGPTTGTPPSPTPDRRGPPGTDAYEPLDDCEGLWIPRGHRDTNLDEEAGIIEVHWWSPRRGNRSVAFAFRHPNCWDNPRTRELIQHLLPSPPLTHSPSEPGCRLSEPVMTQDRVRVFLLKRGARTGREKELVPAARPISPRERGAPLTYALNELFRGTTARERRRGCESYFDSVKRGALRGVSLVDGHAVVDMDGDRMFALGAITATSLMIGQLKATVFQFSTVETAELRLDGSCERFGDAVQTLRCVVLRRSPGA